MGHDVAPVAGGVADGDEEGDVAPPGLGKGLLAPLAPVGGIVGVLQQVGAVGEDEPVEARAAVLRQCVAVQIQEPGQSGVQYILSV
jgi:hypothetical protein